MRQSILVVDDETEICDVLQEFLTQQGYEIFIATSGPEAISLGKEKRPDLALLDIKMPGMDGIEAFCELKKLKKDMEVIILTGHGTLSTAKRAMGLGAYDYLTKPFDLGLVKNIIREALERNERG